MLSHIVTLNLLVRRGHIFKPFCVPPELWTHYVIKVTYLSHYCGENLLSILLTCL